MLWSALFEVSTQKAQHFLFFPGHPISRSRSHSLSLTRREAGQCWGWAGDPQLLPLPTPSSSATLPSAHSQAEIGSVHSQRENPSIPGRNATTEGPCLHCCSHHCCVCCCFPEQEWQSQVQSATSAKNEQHNRKQILAQGKQKITFTWWKAKDG